MKQDELVLCAEFVKLHFVNEQYHYDHSQLIHTHNDILELLYIMSGEGRYIVNGREYTVRAGDLVVCNQGISHGESLAAHHHMQSYCCVFRGLTLPNLPPNTLIPISHTPIYHFTKDRSSYEHLLLALRDLTYNPQESPVVVQLLANTVLNLIFQNVALPQDSDTASFNEDFIQSVVQYLDIHYAENFSLETLSQHYHISKSNLSRMFKKDVGVSPMQYILHRRIGEAQRLLMNSEESIGTIAEQLGFNDNCHFSRTFKKYIGVTPSEYRKHFRDTFFP